MSEEDRSMDDFLKDLMELRECALGLDEGGSGQENPKDDAPAGSTASVSPSFFEGSPDGFMTVGPDGKVCSVNEAFLALTGLGAQSLGRIDVAKLYADPSDHVRFLQELQSSRIVRNFEWKLRMTDGVEKMCLLTAWAQRGVDGVECGYHGIARDIGEQGKTWQDMVQGDRIRALSEMASAAAHYFNNVLQIVVGGTRLALSNLETGSTVDVRTNLEQILESLRSAGDTARLLRRFAGAGKEKMVQVGRVFDLSRTVEKVIEMCLPWMESAPERESIRLSLRPNLQPSCLVRGVENELRDVVLNLVWNAADALPKGGAIWVTTSIENDNVIVTVRDNGVGIAKEHLSKIFQPFWTTKGLQGAGLGLSSSYGIVSYHGGDLTVDSKQGSGSTFTVKLPLAEKAAERVEVRPEVKSTERSYFIMVVDDLEPLLRILKQGLTKRGHRVLTALSGSEALELYKANDVDVVICDLLMPGITGWQVGRRVMELCRKRGTAKTPFVLLTGWGSQVNDPAKLEECGIDAVVEKPMDIPKLIEVVRDIVR